MGFLGFVQKQNAFKCNGPSTGWAGGAEEGVESSKLHGMSTFTHLFEGFLVRGLILTTQILLTQLSFLTDHTTPSQRDLMIASGEKSISMTLLRH